MTVKPVYLAVGAAGVVIAYLWWRSRQAGAGGDVGAFSDPLTSDGYGGSGGGGGSDIASVTPTPSTYVIDDPGLGEPIPSPLSRTASRVVGAVLPIPMPIAVAKAIANPDKFSPTANPRNNIGLAPLPVHTFTPAVQDTSPPVTVRPPDPIPVSRPALVVARAAAVAPPPASPSSTVAAGRLDVAATGTGGLFAGLVTPANLRVSPAVRPPSVVVAKSVAKSGKSPF